MYRDGARLLRSSFRAGRLVRASIHTPRLVPVRAPDEIKIFNIAELVDFPYVTSLGACAGASCLDVPCPR
jgi:hypothetical protein